METPLVSICIPTYNRCEQLRITLDSIVSQLEFAQGKVEIVISDNASTDQTQEVGREYAERYENISYFRNPENIADKNFPLVLSRARGVLRKLNNDTFMIHPGGLAIICGVAEKYKETKPQIFLSNGNCVTAHEQKMSFREFLVTESFYITAITCFAIWDSDCIDIEKNFDGCELHLWQSKRICELASKKDEVLVCGDVIGNTIEIENKDLSYGLFQVFYINFLSTISLYVQSGKVSEQDFASIEADVLFDFFVDCIIKSEINYRNRIYSETENLKELVFNVCRTKPYWEEFQKFYNEWSTKLNGKTALKIAIVSLLENFYEDYAILDLVPIELEITDVFLDISESLYDDKTGIKVKPISIMDEIFANIPDVVMLDNEYSEDFVEVLSKVVGRENVLSQREFIEKYSPETAPEDILRRSQEIENTQSLM